MLDLYYVNYIDIINYSDHRCILIVSWYLDQPPKKKTCKVTILLRRYILNKHEQKLIKHQTKVKYSLLLHHANANIE